MRNHLLSLLVSLLAVTGSLPVAAQRAYAVLTPDDGTLTFYYDNQYAHFVQNHGRVYDMPKPGKRPTWAGDYHARLYQENIKHVVFDVSFSKYRPISTRSWFECCINLKDIKGIRNLNTEYVTNMSWMFFDCKALISLDVSKFNTENVTYMDYMFYGCKALTSLDLSNFNTQNVTNMTWMFSGCEALTSLDVSKFNTQNVTNMGGMFCRCGALTSLDVSKFKTQNVTNMTWMFSGCESLTTIFCNSDWKDSYYNIEHWFMFENCTQLKGTNTAFDANKTGIEMANPTTGYFTSKTTGIDHVKTADRTGDGKAYDLNGRRVNESYKGIIIKNGKKYIQK
ncbi:BspA family leucine-rich repeat surface protein [Hoylesella timonensis]|uniref:BspA family leucine-rich repeat surface protein n=1 Tax=Hoylesella timonensis TaxID=386414 RepID=UPI00288BBB06|nr:BspA family leucine-rich repeat surface protein [Hoylesella timonensis]